MYNNNITFGATFRVNAASAAEALLFEQEGLGAKTVKQLSKSLNKTTHKNHKLVLTHRDRMENKDTFVLRKKGKDGNWSTISSHTMHTIPAETFSIENLKGIYSLLELKVKQEAMEDQLSKLSELKKILN